jgi:hypothetical protein
MTTSTFVTSTLILDTGEHSRLGVGGQEEGGMAQVVEGLPSKFKAESKPQYQKKKKKGSAQIFSIYTL